MAGLVMAAAIRASAAQVRVERAGAVTAAAIRA